MLEHPRQGIIAPTSTPSPTPPPFTEMPKCLMFAFSEDSSTPPASACQCSVRPPLKHCLTHLLPALNMCLRGFLQFLGGLTIPNVSTCALSLILSAYGVNAWFFWLALVVSLASYVREKDLRRGIVVGCVASMWALHWGDSSA